MDIPKLDDISVDRLNWLSQKGRGYRELDVRDFKRFIDLGLAQEAPIEQVMAEHLFVPDLKARLRDRGLSVSGKKEALVSRLVAALSEIEMRQFRDEHPAFQISPLGQAVLTHQWPERQQRRDRLGEEALSLLEASNVEGAARIFEVLQHEEARARGEGSENFLVSPFALIDRAKQALRLSYSDLELPERTRRRVAAIFAFGILRSESFELLANKLHACVGGILPCPSLRQWLRESPCGFMATDYYGPDDESGEYSDFDIARLYAHTKVFEASNSAHLNKILKSDWCAGVEIDCPGDCSACSRGRRVFKKGELQELPKLPRHWGCRCMYLMLRE